MTASVILPIVYGLRAEINNLHKKYKSRLVATLKASIDKRLGQYKEEEIFQIAAALDPRWKLAWCSAKKAEELKKLVILKVRALSESDTVASVDLVADEPPPKRSKFFQFMNNTPLDQPTSCTGLTSQVEKYFNSPCVPEKTDPLDFWKAQQYQQPEMARLNCLFLSSFSSFQWTSRTNFFYWRQNILPRSLQAVRQGF